MTADRQCEFKQISIETRPDETQIVLLPIPEVSLISRTCSHGEECTFDLFFTPLGEQKQLVVRDILLKDACTSIDLLIEKDADPSDLSNRYVDNSQWAKAYKIVYSIERDFPEKGVTWTVMINKQVFYSDVGSMPVEFANGPGWHGTWTGTNASRVWVREFLEAK